MKDLFDTGHYPATVENDGGRNEGTVGKTNLISEYVINTKNDKGIGGHTYHIVNYGIRKVLIIPTQVRVSAWGEPLKEGVLQLDLRR